MMILLFAQPYNLNAKGFHFRTKIEYDLKSKNLIDIYGQKVEEFEFLIIGGNEIDCLLFRELNPNQCDIGAFFTAVENWDEEQKTKVILAVSHCGYSFSFKKNDPDDFDVIMYHVDSIKELAEQFVDDGVYGEIPETLINYIDYDAIARDLSIEYSETKINGQNIVFCMN